MAETDDSSNVESSGQYRPYQGIHDSVQFDGHKNEIAQSYHPGSRLTKLSASINDRVPPVGDRENRGRTHPTADAQSRGRARPAAIEDRPGRALPAAAEDACGQLFSAADGDQVDTVTSALTLPPSPARVSGGDGTRALLTAWPELPSGADPLPGQLDRWLADRGAELVAVRRHLHAHPELSGQEFETAALLARELAVAGLSPRFLPKGNGLLCDIPGNGTTDRIIALRADIDALPLPDTKDVPYQSTVDGVCHACGHDVHTTVLLGTALALTQLADRGELPGGVRLIFQPAEEVTPSGAPEVIAAGGLAGVTAIYALHCYPQLPAGMVGVRSGPLTAAADMVDITLRGHGGHTARPHLTADLVHALGRVVVDVPALLDRRIDPRAGVSMVFGAVHAGDAPNAIPIEGRARATVRVLNREAWHEVPELITGLIEDVVASTGAVAEINYRRGVPPVINDRAATAVVAGAAAAALGPDRVVEAEISMGGEDFAFYLEHVPGAMIRLGVGEPGSTVRLDIHQSTFDVDEHAIGHGVRVMTHTALSALTSQTL